MPLFTLVFTDSSVFRGGDYNTTKWLDIPEKQIRSIFYSLPNGDNLALSGYEKYYHYLEVTTDLNGEKKGIKQFEYCYLIGKKENKYRIYKISFRTNNIEVIDTNENNEIIKNLNPIGWK